MHPRIIAEHHPDRQAVVMAKSGLGLTYAELVDEADRCAQFFHALGLREGDSIALCIENRLEYFTICWAAFNYGLYFTPVSTRLKRNEIAYIVGNCDARVFISSVQVANEVRELPEVLPEVAVWLMLDEVIEGYQSFQEAISSYPAVPMMAATQGVAMMYTSGTTGLPRGVKPPQPSLAPDQPPPLLELLGRLYDFDVDTVYLSPGPLYHAAPLKFNLAVQTLGGTSVVMEKFDPENALRALQQYRVTHSQWVPTMFGRMLRLPTQVRERFDLSSHRVAIHAAAPCPVELKHDMLNWWGPIIHEYYAGSESIGMCAINPQEWLQHPGSVGQAVKGEVHIVGEDGEELSQGQTGQIYFGNGGEFVYHKDAEKTARAHLANGWASFGDIGYVDDGGFLYLTDRRDYVIISGGVNIYPQEAENLLSRHPAVADVAVFGIPNEDFGEEVKAVVKPVLADKAGPELEQELIMYCKSTLASLKCPKTIDFINEMPREPTGKLLKRKLQASYIESH